MVEDDQVKAGALTIIRDCLGLTSGADLVLLVDETALQVVEPFVLAAEEARVHLTTLYYARSQQLKTDSIARIDRNALDSAEAAILVHTAEDACSGFRTKLVSEWRGRTRLATMPGGNAEILKIASQSDYPDMRRRCELLTPPLLNGRKTTITTYGPKEETFELRFTLGGVDRIPVHSIGILRESAWGNVPSGEIFTAPHETSATGQYLVNGTIGRSIIGGEPAVLEFSGGRLTGHRFLYSGERVPYLEELERISNDRADANWNVIAEFGIGVNNSIKTVMGVPLIDEKILGTIHVGIGMNIGWQGTNHALLHLDVITSEPDVEIDGHLIIKKGQHVADPGEFDDLAQFRPRDEWMWDPEIPSLRLRPDSFSLEGESEFRIHLRSTQSGRITEFPIGNEMTAAAARRLLRLSRGSVVALDLSTSVQLGIPQESLLRLLSMLLSYGVIEPAGR